MKIFYSPLLNGFLLEKTAQVYGGKGLVEVSRDTYDEFMAGSETKTMVAGDNGPEWKDVPPLTFKEQVAAAETEKQKRISAANDFISGKQWPGKAAIGRLKSDELTQYNLWLDYLDALEAVDTSEPQKTIWPEPPED